MLNKMLHMDFYYILNRKCNFKIFHYVSKYNPIAHTFDH